MTARHFTTRKRAARQGEPSPLSNQTTRPDRAGPTRQG